MKSWYLLAGGWPLPHLMLMFLVYSPTLLQNWSLNFSLLLFLIKLGDGIWLFGSCKDLALTHTVCYYYFTSFNDLAWVCADVCWTYTRATIHCRVSVLSVFLCLQIFDEEYAVLYLNQGGALVAIRHTPLPIRHLWWVIMTETPFDTAWLIPSEEAPSLKLVKQRQMSLSSNCRDDIILVRKPASHGKICFDGCNSVSPFCVWSRNESSFRWSPFTQQSASALHWIWNKLVRHISGSLACAHSRGISAGL